MNLLIVSKILSVPVVFDFHLNLTKTLSLKSFSTSHYKQFSPAKNKFPTRKVTLSETNAEVQELKNVKSVHASYRDERQGERDRHQIINKKNNFEKSQIFLLDFSKNIYNRSMYQWTLGDSLEDWCNKIPTRSELRDGSFLSELWKYNLMQGN